MKILVTGGCGFIGSAVVRRLTASPPHSVVNVDCLTYAGNEASLRHVDEGAGYSLERVDICDSRSIARVFRDHDPDAVLHLAAESHVDRSIDGPAAFVRTNVVGTQVMLDAALDHWRQLSQADRRAGFRFHHVSTDEVFGDLGPTDPGFTEHTPYSPSSPYSATKAASDHLVRAWHRTYGLPVVITNCSNNYGPYHFPEKLIPHMILNAISGKPLPLYGDGMQVRDWLFVEDHAAALLLVLKAGRVGETYNIGGDCELTNLELVKTICRLLDDLAPDRRPVGLEGYEELITFVADRPGHDRRYAVDTTKVTSELGWRPTETLDSGLKKTVRWYLDNEWWWSDVLSGDYRLERLGSDGTAA